MAQITAIVVGFLFGAVLGWIFWGATGGMIEASDPVTAFIDVALTFGGTGAVSALGYHVVVTKYLRRWLPK